MKRTLLFSFSFLALAGLAVNAQNSMTKSLSFDLSANAQSSLVKKSMLKLSNPTKMNNANFSGYQLGKKSVAAASDLEAFYMLPAGSFYWSPDLVTGSYQPYWAMGPAYADITFQNLSTGSTTQTWTYEEYDPTSEEGFKTATSVEKNLTVNYPLGYVGYPSLSVSNGSQSASYQFGEDDLYFTGANPSFILPYIGGTGEEVIMAAVDNTAINDGFGSLSNNEDSWWKQFADVVELETTGKVKGFAMMLLNPDAPYALSQVYLNFSELAGDESTELTLTAYKVKEENGTSYVSSEVLGTATAVLGDAVSAYYEGTYWLGFVFKNKVGELVQNLPLTVDSGVFLQLDVPEGVQVAPVVNLSSQGMPDYFNSYTVFEDGALLPLHYIGFSDQSGTEYGVMAWNAAFDVTYSWLYTIDNDYRFDVPTEGGSKTFDINALYIPEGWDISDSNNALFDWVDYTPFYDETTGEMSLTFDVDPLPTEIKDRYTYVTVSTPGSSARFTIAQGDGSSVEGVETSAVVVSVVDGNFVVKGSNASVVDVYNVAGQKVASAAVDGETVVNGQDLAKGMYILKFNDNTAIKVVK